MSARKIFSRESNGRLERIIDDFMPPVSYYALLSFAALCLIWRDTIVGFSMPIYACIVFLSVIFYYICSLEETYRARYKFLTTFNIFARQPARRHSTREARAHNTEPLQGAERLSHLSMRTTRLLALRLEEDYTLTGRRRRHDAMRLTLSAYHFRRP